MGRHRIVRRKTAKDREETQGLKNIEKEKQKEKKKKEKMAWFRLV